MITEIVKAESSISDIFLESGAEVENNKGSRSNGVFFFISPRPYTQSEVYSSPIRCIRKTAVNDRAILFLKNLENLFLRSPSNNQESSKMPCETLIKNLE